jgi:retinol dehydrogenase-12
VSLQRSLINSTLTKHRANFRERNEPDIFAALSDPASKFQGDRYNVSKLIEIFIVQELGPILTASAEAGKPPIIINAVNPALCVSALQRHAIPLLKIFINIGMLLVARTTEVGSRTLFAGAVAGRESNGKYMHDCKVYNPSTFVRSEDGIRTQSEVYRQLMVVLERIKPGITANI